LPRAVGKRWSVLLRLTCCARCRPVCNRSTFFSVNARFLLALGLSVPGFPFPIEAFGRNPLDPARASGPIRATCRCSSPFLRPGPSASVAWAPVSRPRNTSDQGGRPSRAKRCRAARAATPVVGAEGEKHISNRHPLAVHVYRVRPALLENWKPPQPVDYRGLHGFTASPYDSAL